jgi:hypothetical protein
MIFLVKDRALKYLVQNSAYGENMAKTLWRLVFILIISAELYGQTSPPVAKENKSAGNILQQQNRAMNVLLGWSGLSMASGAVLLSTGSRVTRDFGWQNLGWGAIDGGIALVAKHAIAEKRRKGFDPEQERKKFRKILLVNALLDIAYIGVGSALAVSRKDNRKGHGYGVIVQGSFLFLFDGINYWKSAL